MSNKIGIGIITCNRKYFFEQLISSIPEVDKIVIVNDGIPYGNNVYSSKISEVIQHKRNKGIAKTKNDALKYLLEHQCDHIFLFEDDIALSDSTVIEKYIHASEVSGILHFNYAYHGPWNKDKNGAPNPRITINYPNNIKIDFHYNITGALSYFRRNVLTKVGLMDENYKNVLEHVDHTLQIIKHGFHPPFRWFADIGDSYKFIYELDPDLDKSINSQSLVSPKFRAKIFEIYFMMKNGYRPYKAPTINEEQLLKVLDELKNRFAI